jgi:hypothetical protein
MGSPTSMSRIKITEEHEATSLIKNLKDNKTAYGMAREIKKTINKQTDIE